MKYKFTISPVSEDSALISFVEAGIEQVRSMRDFCLAKIPALIDIVPAYQTVLLRYDCLRVTYDEVERIVIQWQFIEQEKEEQFNGVVHKIPVYYDIEVAADLDNVCVQKGVSLSGLIGLHTAQSYLVYAIGFQPGFAYLGYVPEAISMPRHTSFKAQVSAGSVAIADRQTAIYPADLPGGWQVIGRTPVSVYQDHQALFSVGDRVQFESVSKEQYVLLGGELGNVGTEI